jgi:hypothetical protein
VAQGSDQEFFNMEKRRARLSTSRQSYLGTASKLSAKQLIKNVEPFLMRSLTLYDDPEISKRINKAVGVLLLSLIFLRRDA